MRVVLIAARSDNNVIGKEGRIPWHLPADLRRFKALTTGHIIIMGRKTFQSIGRPLPDRLTVVVTRDPNYAHSGVTVVHSPEAALAFAEQGLFSPTQQGGVDVFVCGGADIYRLALPFANRMYLTQVHTVVRGDVLFPDFSSDEWELTESDPHEADDKNVFDYTFEVWVRRDQVSGVRLQGK
jgi:dihydrofolate reductase